VLGLTPLGLLAPGRRWRPRSARPGYGGVRSSRRAAGSGQQFDLHIGVHGPDRSRLGTDHRPAPVCGRGCGVRAGHPRPVGRGAGSRGRL